MCMLDAEYGEQKLHDLQVHGELGNRQITLFIIVKCGK